MSELLQDKWIINYNDIVFKDRVGKGQFGNVYKADYFGTEVCVKKILSDFKDDIEQAKCVAREVEVLKYVYCAFCVLHHTEGRCLFLAYHITG